MHRSLLVTNCESDKLLDKQRTSKADVAFIDLEDGVAPPHKDAARHRALTALKDWDYLGKERWVRINEINTAVGMKDVLDLAEGQPDALIPAKVRSPKELETIDYLLTRQEESLGLPIGGIKLCPMIESGPAMLFLQDIIKSSSRIAGLLLGAGDLSVDVGYIRTKEEHELDFVRGHMVLTAHTFGVEVYDVTSVVVHDPESVYLEAKRAREHGFDGKACISPSQIEAIHRGFAPSEEELLWATGVLAGRDEALARGETIFGFEGTMVAPPVLMAAERIVASAVA